MSHRPSINSTGTIVATEQTSHLEILATSAEAAPNGTLPQSCASTRADPNTNEESDSSPGIETPDSDDEAEYYDSSIPGDAKEQSPNAGTEAVRSAEELTNGPNHEAESGTSG